MHVALHECILSVWLGNQARPNRLGVEMSIQDYTSEIQDYISENRLTMALLSGRASDIMRIHLNEVESSLLVITEGYDYICKEDLTNLFRITVGGCND